MASDTIKMLGVTRAELYALWPTTYEGLFTTLMEQFAAREQATYWLEKTNENTVMVDKLAQMYPNAKFVATRRDLLANMRSTVGRYDLRGRKREVRIVRAAVDWVRHNKAVDDFARRHPERIYCLSYEDLKEDIEGTLAGICAFLELDYDPTMAVQAFKANTTFREGRKRDEVFRPRDKRLMDAAVKAANLVPLAVLNALAGDLTQAAHKKEIPDWFFSLYEPVALSSNEASQAASIRSVPDTVPRLPKTYAPQGEVFSSVS